MNKKIAVLILVALGCLLTAAAFAADMSNAATIEEVKSMAQGTHVTVKGIVKERRTENHFMLSDSSGEISLYVADDVRKAFPFKPEDRLKITGVVEMRDGMKAIAVSNVEWD